MGKNYKDRESIIVDFSKRLRKERKRLKMTQKQLADEIGVDIKTIGNWEQCNTLPKKLDDALALCNLFECDIDYLFGQQKEKTKAATDICEATGLKPEAVKCLLDKGKNTWNKDFLSYFVTHVNFSRIAERVTRNGTFTSFIRVLRGKGLFERVYQIYAKTRTWYWESNMDDPEMFNRASHFEKFKQGIISSVNEGVFSEDEIKEFDLDVEVVEGEYGIVHELDSGIRKIFDCLYEADNIEKEYWIINNLFQQVIYSYLKIIDITEDEFIKACVEAREG